MIRKATPADIDQIENIYTAIHDAEESGTLTIGWLRGVYPVRQTAVDGIARGDMFVAEDGGEIVAAAVINQIQLPEYANCRWVNDVPDSEIMVLHTLVVDPRIQSKGHGTAFVKFYEQYALDHGCRYLRMDTQEKNAGARRFYKKLGFSEPGITSCTFNGIPGVRLVCLEKKL